MRILGVDPGTHRLGYGIVEVDGPERRCLDRGCLYAKRTDAIEQRLHQLHGGLVEIVERWSPDHLAVEEPFVDPKHGSKTAVAVGQAQALALIVAAGAGMAIHRYAPRQVKRAIADYGGSGKAQLQRALRLLLTLPDAPMEEDTSDALAVALCHVQHWRTLQKVNGL